MLHIHRLATTSSNVLDVKINNSFRDSFLFLLYEILNLSISFNVNQFYSFLFLRFTYHN